MWIAPSAREPAFWLSVLTELQNRGVKDIFIACVDGLTGLPEAIETVYPREPSAVVHGSYGESIRLGYVSHKHMRIGGDRSASRSTRPVPKRKPSSIWNSRLEKWDGLYPSISRVLASPTSSA
jgi:putative transposase